MSVAGFYSLLAFSNLRQEWLRKQTCRTTKIASENAPSGFWLRGKTIKIEKLRAPVKRLQDHIGRKRNHHDHEAGFMARKLISPIFHVIILAEKAEADEKTAGHRERTDHQHAPTRQANRID